MATLKVTSGKAAGVLGAQIEAGRRVVDAATEARSEELYQAWKRNYQHWIDVTKDAVGHIYAGDEEVKSFEDKARYRAGHMGEEWPESREGDVKAAEDAIGRLGSLSSALQFADEPAGDDDASSSASGSATSPATRNEIFLVHGHDNRRAEVARFLERAGQNQYSVVILDEQPGRSETLIERLERYSANVAYAVILFTGDDLGGVRSAAPADLDLYPRARQNVVFEFGWFCGKIGRDHVAVLYEPKVELPSDISGLTYINLGQADWGVLLVRDLRDAGLAFSMDHV